CVLLWNSQLAQPLEPLQIVNLLSTAPARIMGLPAGTLQVGAPADVAVIDPNLRWRVNPAKLRSRSRNTPFKGWELVGQARYTFVEGTLVHAAE
ncbi:MAG: amidohydrolase family protein, partial [Fimbriimonadales bacterium]